MKNGAARLACSCGRLGPCSRPRACSAALRHAFLDLSLDEVVSFTAVRNVNARRVMEKLGLCHDPQADFDHPGVPEGSPLRRHVLYRMSASGWPRRQPDKPEAGRS